MLLPSRLICLVPAILLALTACEGGDDSTTTQDAATAGGGGTGLQSDSQPPTGSEGGAGATSGPSGGGGSSTPGDGALPPVSCARGVEKTGEATFYDFADGSGNCSFPKSPQDLMVGAMNHVDYADSAVCGACVSINGPKGTQIIRVVDQCPDCPAGNIDLSPTAFDKIAERSQGRVPIHWSYVRCDVSGALIFHFKDGSNAYWTGVQVRNHAFPVAKFEYKTKAGAFKEVHRESYNFFVEPSGMGEGPFTFRVTDSNGDLVESSGIPLKDDADAPGTGQFPACSSP